MAEQLTNLKFKPWMKINGNIIQGKDIRSDLGNFTELHSNISFSNSLNINSNYTLPDSVPNSTENQQLAISYNSVDKKLGFISLPPAQGGINWLNEYDNATEYFIDDAVSYNGSSYICILTTTGNNPDNVMFWNLMASMGQQGKTGSSSSFFNYKISTDVNVSSTGKISYNDITQPLSSILYISSFDSSNNNINAILALLNEGDELLIQQQNDSSLNQVFTITGIPNNSNITWWEIPVFNKSYTASFVDSIL
jgi:hypothetical protein